MFQKKKLFFKAVFKRQVNTYVVDRVRPVLSLQTECRMTWITDVILAFFSREIISGVKLHARSSRFYDHRSPANHVTHTWKLFVCHEKNTKLKEFVTNDVLLFSRANEQFVAFKLFVSFKSEHNITWFYLI